MKTQTASRRKAAATPPAKPRRIQQGRRDWNLIQSGRTYSPDEVAAALRMAETGEPGQLHAFYDEMRARDPHLGSEVEKAEEAISNARFDLLAFPPRLRTREQQRSGEGAIAADVAEWCDEQLRDPAVRLDRAVEALLTAEWKGLAAIEVTVEPDGKRERLVGLEPVPSQRFRWNLSGVPDLLVQLTDQLDSAVPVSTFPVGGLIVAHGDENIPSVARRGAFRSLLGLVTLKMYGPGWWSKFVELFGSPVRIGKFPAGNNETAEILRDALENMGHSGWGLIPENALIEIIEASKNGTVDVHERALDWADRAASKRIRGATQTTDIQQGAGSKASAGVHSEVVMTKDEGRAARIGGILRTQLLQPMVSRSWGEAVAAKYTPVLAFHVRPVPTMGEFADAAEKLVNAGFGPAIPLSIVNEMGYFPVPGPGEPTLGAKPTPAPIVTPPDPEDVPGEKPDPEDTMEPVEASLHRRKASAQETLDRKAQRLANGSGEELTAPYRTLINAAVEEGISLNQLLSRVLHQITLPVEAPHLSDMLAAVQLEAIARGIQGARK